MQELKLFRDTEIKNIVLFAIWTFFECLQLVIIVVFIFSFIPIAPNPFVQTLFPLHQKGVLPEREMLFYRIFVFANIALQAATLYFFRKRLGEERLGRSIIFLTTVNAFWIFMQLFAVFKIIVVGNLAWARYLFYVSLGLAVASRIFWPEFKNWLVWFYQAVIQRQNVRLWAHAWDIVFLLMIILLIFVPDMDKVLARMFVWDQFYHLDGFLMAPAWAYQQGLTLNMDVISEYSMALPILVSHISKLMGGLNYYNVVALLIGAAMFYYIGFYFLLRQWLGSLLLASFGVLLAIKLQMFHWGVSPLIWQFPTATVIRYVFDLGALWFLLQHCRTLDKRYLWGCAAVCGAALGYMLDTGIYLNAAFYFYLGTILVFTPVRQQAFKFPKDATNVVALAFTPLVLAALVLLILQGPSIFNHALWKNMLEHARLFLQGWGALPMYDGLKDRQFFAFIMGFVIPVVYVWTLLFVGASCLLRQAKWENFFVAVLCVYGLGLYHYFIVRSAVSSYYVVSIPFVAIVCYWLRNIFSLLGAAAERNLKLTSLAWMFGALLTSHLFTFYPNAFNLAGFDWKPEQQAYHTDSNFDKDAGMVKRLTSPDDRVPVISSFEVKILMDAGRKPFFYYFPLVESTPMKAAKFRGTYLHTVERMQKTLSQLETSKPEYIFFEKKLITGQIPAEYYQYYQTLTTLIMYVQQHYTPSEEGVYLVALKRK